MPRDQPQTPQRAPGAIYDPPTKRAKALILHDDTGLSYKTICERSPFKNIQPRTLARNCRLVKDHGGNCYYDGRRGNSGRKRVISDEQLQEAEERLVSGELNDGEDVRREMFPDVRPRTVRNSLARFGLLGFVQRKKPNLLPRQIARRGGVCGCKDWTLGDTFARGVLINSDESKIELAVSDGRRYVRRRRGQDALAPRSVQGMEAHGRKGVRVNVWGAIHPLGVSKLIRIDGTLNAEFAYNDSDRVPERRYVPLQHSCSRQQA
ncbi:hypothetical protein R3P38DRAFT_2758737 [Favolaschia claudopus]|uniref:Transposase Tc1-like domain-containing protein n=1 Tax=Favolaschia claudopus TaxID=2862362 RepID=A0AAW0E530_9AGAR